MRDFVRPGTVAWMRPTPLLALLAALTSGCGDAPALASLTSAATESPQLSSSTGADENTATAALRPPRARAQL